MLFLLVALSWGLYSAIFLILFSWISSLFFFFGFCVIIFILLDAMLSTATCCLLQFSSYPPCARPLALSPSISLRIGASPPLIIEH